MRQTRSHKEKSALELIDEAIGLLKSAPLDLLSGYYIGSLPFVLIFLYYWSDMSRNALAHERLQLYALTLALLFMWMKFWHTIYGMTLRAHLIDRTSLGLKFKEICQLAASQTMIQCTGFIVLPLAFLIVLPLGWCYAYYQNACAPNIDGDYSVSAIHRFAKQQCLLWPMQNHYVLSILSLFGIFVFINVASAVMLVPYALKSILGVDTWFTISGMAAYNTTFLMAVICITHICVDPLIKAIYALRCFYGESLKTGDDIKAELKRQKMNKLHLASMILFLFGMFVADPAFSDQAVTAVADASAKPAISAGEMEQRLSQIIRQPEFAWRLARKQETTENETEDSLILFEWLRTAWDWIYDGVKGIGETIGKWVDAIIDWFKKLMPEKESEKDEADAGQDWRLYARSLIYFMFALLLVFIFIFLKKAINRHLLKKQGERQTGIEATPDLKTALENDTISADDMPVNEWIALANEFLIKGELRLALRAYYLATLADLSGLRLIAIAKYKSNRDYTAELKRRGHLNAKVYDLFANQALCFDRFWYGMHALGRDDVVRFYEQYQRIISLVQV